MIDGGNLPDPRKLVAEAVQAGVVPSAVLAYGRGTDGPVDVAAFGAGVGPDTRYDLASLTKVTATLPCVLRLAEAGEIGLDDQVVKYLPGFGTDSAKERVTIRHLLTHTSGLPAILEVWRLPGTAEERFAAVLAEPLQAPVGSVVKYSDPGFIMLGRIVADVTGKPLPEAFREMVAGPLGMAATGFLPAGHAAPTEANWFDDPERQDPKSGVVHDENAESLGGVAGQAGLFGNASDLAAYLRAGWLDEDSPILAPATRAEALRCQTDGDGLDGRRGLGWTLRGDSHDFMSDQWPATGAGHTGFTGTSLAFDPVTGIWCVLLTNAVLFGRDNRARQLRRSLHAAVAAGFGVALQPHNVPEDGPGGGPGSSLNTGDDDTGPGFRITA
ncbi:CubicO group peptidase (beta-lactamase class C family) [Catenulispora sp. GP43]|uniref:serine hydrolase domain-containing protein n=1 Tax=Catenulispora sp. GP43 TaxID=3156263 RepID=UPI0035159B84